MNMNSLQYLSGSWLWIVSFLLSAPSVAKKKTYLLLCSSTAKKNIGFGSDIQQQKSIKFAPEKNNDLARYF